MSEDPSFVTLSNTEIAYYSKFPIIVFTYNYFGQLVYNPVYSYGIHSSSTVTSISKKDYDKYDSKLMRLFYAC